MTLAGAAPALIAAILFGIGSALQQRSARACSRLVLPTRRRAGLRLANLMLGSPTWWAGALIALTGFAFHALALHTGSLAVVQPILMLTLPISLLAGHARGGHLARRDWVGIALVCGSIAVFLGLAAPRDGPPRGPAALPALTLACAVLTLILALAGTHARPAARGIVTGSAAAVILALTAALTKATTADLTTGGLPGVLAHWHGYALVAAAAIGVGLERAAFAHAPLAAVMLPVTVLNPVAAICLGLLGWHEPLAATATTLTTTVITTLAAATIGVSILTRSPLLHPPPPRVH